MYEGELARAGFISRDNRFAATVVLDGREVTAHVPNSGRMAELLVPGADSLLSRRESPGRKTDWDLVAMRAPNGWVSVDSRVPNQIFAEAVGTGIIPELDGYRLLRAEVPWGSSRFDFLLEGPNGEALVEVKGCTLVRDDGLALFPDAPTTRGARHMRELTEARDQNIECFAVIIIQRGDGRLFAPNDNTDRTFGDALREAASAGVRVLAYSTSVSPQGVEIGARVPVDLEACLREVAS
jgi:sugar fermentation stimulation protein A